MTRPLSRRIDALCDAMQKTSRLNEVAVHVVSAMGALAAARTSNLEQGHILARASRTCGQCEHSTEGRFLARGLVARSDSSS